MRRTLKEKQGGVFRVLRSAGQLRAIRGLVGKEGDYNSAYNYLHGHSRWMDYAERRRLRVPIAAIPGWRRIALVPGQECS